MKLRQELPIGEPTFPGGAGSDKTSLKTQPAKPNTWTMGGGRNQNSPTMHLRQDPSIKPKPLTGRGTSARRTPNAGWDPNEHHGPGYNPNTGGYLNLRWY